MGLAYLFLALEGAVRFALLYFASLNFILYGELSYIFTLSLLIGSLVSFGSGQVILLENHKEEFCLTVLLYLTLMAISFVLILEFSTELKNTEIGFFAFLYPTLSLLAPGCRKSLNILIRFQKIIFWICFLAAIFEINYIKSLMIIFVLVNCMAYTFIVKNKYSNFISLVKIYTTSLNIKFFISSVSNNGSRFLERSIMLLILPSSSSFGQFQALRDTSNLPMFLLGPLIGEKMLKDKGLKNILHLIIAIIFFGLLVQFFFLERLIPQDISLILIVMICSLFDIGKVVINVLAEINNLFFQTWFLKFLFVLSLLIILYLNLNEFNQIFIFLGFISFCYMTILFILIRKNKSNAQN